MTMVVAVTRVVQLYDYDIKKLKQSPWNTMKIDLADIFYLFGESPPSIYPLHFRYIYISVYILLNSMGNYIIFFL